MSIAQQVIDLCGLWRFQPDAAEEGERLGYPTAESEPRMWREAMLPATFERCLPGLASYEGAVWFRRECAVPDHWRGKRVRLQFEGVNYHAKVWVNGQWVGRNEDGFLPFEFAVHHALRCGGRNSVTVCVDNIRRQGEVPGMERGWRPFGGVLREVRLAAGDLLRIESAHIVAEPAGRGGGFRLRAGVVNERGESAQAELRVAVLGSDGSELRAEAAEPRRLASGGTAEVEVQAAVPNVTPWSPERPALYTAAVELRAAGEVVDRREIRFGFRRVEARDGKLLLNGEPMILRGFNRHEDSPAKDMATDLDAARDDLIQMKRMGVNFVRLCHYPHHPGELDLCDEIGLLVMGEIPLYWWNGLAEGEENCRRKLEAAKR